MKEGLNILDELVGLEFNLANGIFEKQEELQSLYQDRFKLNDLNISARVLNYWKGQGMLPDKSDADSLSPLETDNEKKIRVDNRFNFFELIYLYILQDLREIGLSLEKLKNVKDFLFQKLDVLDFLNHISDSSIEVMRKDGVDTSVLEELLKHKEEAVEHIDEFPDNIRYISIIHTLIISILLNKWDVRLIVSMDGDVSFEKADAAGQIERRAFNVVPHVQIPLFYYLFHFMSMEKYDELYVPYKLLDEQEKLILDHVRSGKYIDIKIKFNHKKTITLELTEEFKADNAARLQEILLKRAYQDLRVKTANGVISYSTIKTNKRI